MASLDAWVSSGDSSGSKVYSLLEPLPGAAATASLLPSSPSGSVLHHWLPLIIFFPCLTLEDFGLIVESTDPASVLMSLYLEPQLNPLPVGAVDQMFEWLVGPLRQS